MDLGSTTLTEEQIEQFQDDGYVVIKGAFPAEDALAIQSEWWVELAEVYGILRDDRSTWRQPRADLKRAKTAAISKKIASTRVRSVMDGLLGGRPWPEPRHWGRVLTTFPRPGVWDVPAGTWHSDSLYVWHRPTLNGLQLFSFIGPVRPGGGGTLILAGSHRLLSQRGEALVNSGRLPPITSVSSETDAFYRSHPWLAALNGATPSPIDRITHFMEIGAEIDGVPVRVVELTGGPGDVVFCHPLIAHTAAPNHGAFPRFMRISGLMTQGCLDLRAGRRLTG